MDKHGTKPKKKILKKLLQATTDTTIKFRKPPILIIFGDDIIIRGIVYIYKGKQAKQLLKMLLQELRMRGPADGFTISLIDKPGLSVYSTVKFDPDENVLTVEKEVHYYDALKGKDRVKVIAP